MKKTKENNSSAFSYLKSPTRCTTTANTSINIGSITRAEGDIV